ncbi:MAG: hypothetical protein HY432_02370 [Candidatus Liptonbacteria bacterium]|nr:hypothetical protein [Candidatus Liptonbacteria bacterium]
MKSKRDANCSGGNKAAERPPKRKRQGTQKAMTESQARALKNLIERRAG